MWTVSHEDLFINQGLGYHHLTRCLSLLIAQAPVDASSASNGNILKEMFKEVARENRVLSLLIFGVKSNHARFKGFKLRLRRVLCY